MKKELDSKLCTDYAEMFVNRYADMKTTAMCWGFECGDGWYNLINALCASIQSEVEHSKCPPVVVDQVKEKFGTLRFYYHGGNERIEGMVTMAEAMSEAVCESCGNPGVLRGGTWIQTLCDEHAGGRKPFHMPTEDEVRAELEKQTE